MVQSSHARKHDITRCWDKGSSNVNRRKLLVKVGIGHWVLATLKFSLWRWPCIALYVALRSEKIWQSFASKLSKYNQITDSDESKPSQTDKCYITHNTLTIFCSKMSWILWQKRYTEYQKRDITVQSGGEKKWLALISFYKWTAAFPSQWVWAYLLGKRGFEDGERLCDTFHNLFSCFCVVETKQHGLSDVSPPGGQTAQDLLQLVPLPAERKTWRA